MDRPKSLRLRIFECIGRFIRERGGSTAVVFAVSVPALLLSVGGGIDLSRAIGYRQKLSNAVDLACGDAALEINYAIFKGASATGSFKNTVDPLVTRRINEAGLGASATSVNTASATVISITARGSSPTIFQGVLKTNAYPITVARTCRFSQPNQAPPTGTNLFVESFEQAHSVAMNDWTVLGRNNSTWNNWTTKDAGIEIGLRPLK